VLLAFAVAERWKDVLSNAMEPFNCCEKESGILFLKKQKTLIFDP
jgi:hypothetical protein